MMIVHACELCGYTGMIGVRQLAPHRKPDSIFRGLNNHKIDICCFMIYDLCSVDPIRKFVLSFGKSTMSSRGPQLHLRVC